MADKCTACRPIDAEHLKRWIIARGLENEKKGYPPLSAGEILEQIERELTFEAHDKRPDPEDIEMGDVEEYMHAKYFRKAETPDKRTEMHSCDNQYCIQNGGDVCDRVHCPIGQKQTFYDDITDEQEQLDFVQKHERIPVVMKVKTHGDVISRAAAMTEIQMNTKRLTLAYEAHGEGFVQFSDLVIGEREALDILRDLPSEEPERKTGRWIGVGFYDEDCKHHLWYSCDKCGYQTTWHMKPIFKYCPNCGAKMEEP